MIQPSPSLLVPYISTAAYQAMQGDALSERSQWALESAIEQLDAQREAREFVEGDDWRGAVALAAVSEGRSGQLADLVLSVGDSDRSPEDRMPARGSDELQALVQDLRCVARSEGDVKLAAERLSGRFDRIVDSLLQADPAVGEYDSPVGAVN